MIVIISKTSLEIPTEIVIEWLYKFGASYIRVNGDELTLNKSFCIPVSEEQDTLEITKTKLINLKSVSVVWFRRWSDRSFLMNAIGTSDDGLKVPYMFLENLNIDYHIFRNFLFSKFCDKPFISNPLNSNRLNKFEMLSIAKKIGLNIPTTMVCNNKNDLLIFINKYKSVITKDMESSSFVKVGPYYYSNFTASIPKSALAKLPEKFALSVFQEKIEKEYEVRVFYFFGKCFSMAIFSQSDSKTETDFRKYNKKKPNRNIPYILNHSLNSKITLLMKKLGLETGSIDLIKKPNGEYIFLEVNPVGQFGMVSKPCNYNLEYIIAKKLFSYEKKKSI